MNAEVIIALGSNLGDPRQHVLAAIERLQAFAASSFFRSSLWETEPIDCPPGSPLFINAVVAFFPKPDQTPESLLKDLQELEKQFGREQKKVLNEARPLDLDLIAFGNLT